MFPSYGVKFVQIKSGFSSQDAVIVKQTDSLEIAVDVSLFTDGTFDGTPQLTSNQNGGLLALESKANLVSSSSSPSSRVSGADKLQTLASKLILGLFVFMVCRAQKNTIAIAALFGLVSLSMENCSPQALFTVTIPSSVQSVCLNDQCFTNSPTSNLGVAALLIDPTDREMKMLSAAFSVVRSDLDWGSIEYNAPQSYDFSAYDALFNTLRSFNLTTYWILDYKNSFYDNGNSPSTETSIGGFVNYTMQALELFNGNGSVWEMYNEPNIY